MEQVKGVKERRITKADFGEKKQDDGINAESKVVIVDREFGIKLTLDNSLQRFANDPFIVEQTKIANKKFAKSK
jgi:hypothetical protein